MISTSVKLRDQQVSPTSLLRSFGKLTVKLADHEVCETYKLQPPEFYIRMHSDCQKLWSICKFVQTFQPANMLISQFQTSEADLLIEGKPVDQRQTC